MKKKPIVAIIGGASLVFGTKALRDIVNHPELEGSTFRFMDINEEHLETISTIGKRLANQISHQVKIEATTNRQEALKGADYVIISVDVSVYELGEQDYSLPNKLGIRQVGGELGGPGGLFHSLRQIPLHLEFARDIENLCPNALVMVESNPLNRICLAMQRYSKIDRLLGLCHGVEIVENMIVNKMLGLGKEEIMTTTAGVNHLTWILDLRLKSTGEDLYPLLKEKIKDYDPNYHSLNQFF